MALPSNLFTTAFQHQKLGFLMFLILIIMVYLGSLAMAAQALLARTAIVWGHDLEGRFTVEVPATFKEGAEEHKKKGEKVLAALQKIEGIDEVVPISREEIARLLNPWISDEKLLSALPLPFLIDVQLISDASHDADKLKKILSQEVESVQVYAHAGWMGSLMGFVRGLGGLASVMLLLTGLAIVAVVGIVCRAAISAQHETISLLHYMGATDKTIASAFQEHVKKLALPASIIGFSLAIVTVVLLALMLGVMGGMSLVAPLAWVTMGIVMAIVPAVAAGIAILTARFSVQRLLRRLT